MLCEKSMWNRKRRWYLPVSNIFHYPIWFLGWEIVQCPTGTYILLVSNCMAIEGWNKSTAFFQFMYTIFQIATKLSEYINIKLFGPSHLINRTIKYFFWPLAAMKKKSLSQLRAWKTQKFGNLWPRDRWSPATLSQTHLAHWTWMG